MTTVQTVGLQFLNTNEDFGLTLQAHWFRQVTTMVWLYVAFY